MKTASISNLQQLKAYRSDLFQKRGELNTENRVEQERRMAADATREAEAAKENRAPRELQKGRLLDVYG